MLYDVRKEGVMPTMYDEQGRRIELPYTPEGMAKAAAAKKGGNGNGKKNETKNGKKPKK